MHKDRCTSATLVSATDKRDPRSTGVGPIGECGMACETAAPAPTWFLHRSSGMQAVARHPSCKDQHIRCAATHTAAGLAPAATHGHKACPCSPAHIVAPGVTAVASASQSMLPLGASSSLRYLTPQSARLPMLGVPRRPMTCGQDGWVLHTKKHVGQGQHGCQPCRGRRRECCPGMRISMAGGGREQRA